MTIPKRLHVVRHPVVAIAHALLIITCACGATDLQSVQDVEPQPFTAQVRRLLEATDYLGSPFSREDQGAIDAAMTHADAVGRLQEVLDRHCLFDVHINPELRVKVAAGLAKAELQAGGWRQFLVKVRNEAGTTACLRASSPNAAKVQGSPSSGIADLWLDLQMFDAQPLTRTLSGLGLEYRIVQLYSRDSGRREARIGFHVGQGTQDLGFRNEVDMLFQCLPARGVKLKVRDENGRPTTAAFVIRDARGQVHPSLAKRLAPDFAFHPQVYRHDGESLSLPDGTYSVEFERGPESVPQRHTLTVAAQTPEWSFQVERWIDPSLSGWWSGDHHIHAAGCAHYEKPTEGVHAMDMLRHCLGEDLKVGANLTWGPCFDYQKQFFTGDVDKVSTYPYLLRYDVEVSGFGSHKSGHLCLLRLRNQIYPGGESDQHWPTLGLNTLRWAKQQGAVCGPAHSGWGLEVDAKDLPNYIVPPFDGIGANEYIVDVTHDVPGTDDTLVRAVDFLSVADTPPIWELNIWYHTLNCGFRTRISGETDFPCIYGERVGLGRSYVKLDGRLDYDAWCEGIRRGRNYAGDGRSHLFDFAVDGASMGEGESELVLEQPRTVTITARVAARLREQPDLALRDLAPTEKPYWHIERARIGATQQVPVEVVVNGYPVAKRDVVADGTVRDVAFEVPVERSSWIALRILPSSHTNPIFVLVGGKPIRASKRSANWCLDGVDQCWSQKKRFIAAGELQQALLDYEHARAAYRRILAESDVP